MPEKSVGSANYRYAFNGMEVDNEVSGNGNSYTTEFRQYDPRLGRWKSLDPLMGKFPWMSPYVTFDNNPVYYTDIYGLSSGGPGDPLNVIVIIFSQDEIDLKLVNSPDVIGDFFVIIATTLEKANAELEKIRGDGQCYQNLLLIAHGGEIRYASQTEGDKNMTFYIHMDDGVEKKDKGITAREILDYYRNPGVLSEETIKDIDALSTLLLNVDTDGTVCVNSCNLGDDINLMRAIVKLGENKERVYYFNADKSLYYNSGKSFTSKLGHSLTANFEEGWIMFQGADYNYVKNISVGNNGEISIDIDLEHDTFVIPRSNNEMEDNAE